MGAFWGGLDQRSCPSTRRPEPPRQIAASKSVAAVQFLVLTLITVSRLGLLHTHETPHATRNLNLSGPLPLSDASQHRLQKRPSGCPTEPLEMCAAGKIAP